MFLFIRLQYPKSNNFPPSGKGLSLKIFVSDYTNYCVGEKDTKLFKKF